MTEWYQPIERDNSAVIQMMSDIGEGDHACGCGNGWISIERDGEKWDVMWTSHKESHNRLGGPAFTVCFTPDRIKLVAKTAISLHPVRDLSERLRYADKAEAKVSQAIKQAKRRQSRSGQNLWARILEVFSEPQAQDA